MHTDLSEKDKLHNDDHFERSPLRQKLYIIIFGTSTPLGKLFDVVLLILILLSVAAVMLESVSYINLEYGHALRIIEWVLTGFFTIEYLLRIYVVRRPAHYIFSLFGIIDFLSIIPTFLSLVLIGTQSLSILRALRLVRVFRVMKLVRFVNESQVLGKALLNSRHKITVFFLFVLIIVFIMGTIMYLVEGPGNGFNSIPISIYWAIVTLTTVGFGDIYPVTVAGQVIASVIMLLGYSIIAIPTGIIGGELYKSGGEKKLDISKKTCNFCQADEHQTDAVFCRKCGEELPDSNNIRIT